MTKHTAGPWRVDAKFVIRPKADDTFPIAECNFLLKADEANAARIVECVNALEGINPSAIRELVEAGEATCKYFADKPGSPAMRGRVLALRSALDKIKEVA